MAKPRLSEAQKEVLLYLTDHNNIGGDSLLSIAKSFGDVVEDLEAFDRTVLLSLVDKGILMRKLSVGYENDIHIRYNFTGEGMRLVKETLGEYASRLTKKKLK